VFQVFGTASLDSFWYWVLSILIWSLVCNRTLGVPHDMVRRARRAPETAERVDLLALIGAERIGRLHDLAGVPLAALGGFGLAVAGVAAFGLGLELAKAAFLLAFPLSIVAVSTLRLALVVRRRRLGGPLLRRLLAVRRFWHTVVAIAAIMVTASLAVTEHPSLFLH
jgi:hypothetical protein